jgi:hypothetical protein
MVVRQDRVRHAAIKMRLKHGRHTAEALAQRRQLKELLRQSRALIRRVGAAPRIG